MGIKWATKSPPRTITRKGTLHRDSQLKDVEQNLDRIFKENVDGLFNAEMLNSIKLLESKKCKLLLDKENDWRIKSRAI